MQGKKKQKFYWDVENETKTEEEKYAPESIFTHEYTFRKSGKKTKGLHRGDDIET